MRACPHPAASFHTIWPAHGSITSQRIEAAVRVNEGFFRYARSRTTSTIGQNGYAAGATVSKSHETSWRIFGSRAIDVDTTPA